MKNMVITNTFLRVAIFLSMLTSALAQEPTIWKTYESSRVFLNTSLKLLQAEEKKIPQRTIDIIINAERERTLHVGGERILQIEDEKTKDENIKNGGKSEPLISSIVKSKIDQWEKNPSEKNWITAMDSVTVLACHYSVNSDITVISKPTNGAIIKYQTVGDRYRNKTPFTAKGLTACIETLPIGYYHIWSERDGKSTSDKDNIYQIIKHDEIVEINENKWQ